MMTKSELESTNLFKIMRILESNGYRPEGFRYRKDVAYAKLGIEDDTEKDGTFALYVDVLVNSYPPSLNDLYPNCFFEVPQIEYVYNNTKNQVKISSISDNLFIPTREIIIAMKIHSLPTRGNIRHKMVKDLCDLYGLLWYSPRSLNETTKELAKFLERNSLELLKNKIDPGDPIEENVYKLSPEKKREYNIGSLPISLKGALDSLTSDSKFLEDVFTKDFLEKYTELKYKEYSAFAQTPTAWEVSMYADA